MYETNQQFIDLLWELERLEQILNNSIEVFYLKARYDIDRTTIIEDYNNLFNLIETTYPQYLDLI